MQSINLPVILKDKELISPGIWNDNEYSEEEIRTGFAKTNWSDKDTISLWLNHDDKNADAFIGYVRNIRLIDGAKVRGDLELWDERIALKLTKAKAKFGVSVKIKGDEDKKTGKMKNFSFENFSVVTNPACKTAYINLQENGAIETYLISQEWIDNHNNEKEVKKMEEEVKEEVKEKVVEEVKEVSEEKVEEEKPEEVKEVEKSEEQKEELSDGDLTNMYVEMDEHELSAFSAFVKDYLKKHEGASIKDAAKAWKDKKEMDDKLGELSEAELLSEINKRMEILKKKKKEPEKEPEKEDEKLAQVDKRLSEIEEKMKSPKSKTVRALSSETPVEEYSSDKFISFLNNLHSPYKVK